MGHSGAIKKWGSLTFWTSEQKSQSTLKQRGSEQLQAGEWRILQYPSTLITEAYPPHGNVLPLHIADTNSGLRVKAQPTKAELAALS